MMVLSYLRRFSGSQRYKSLKPVRSANLVYSLAVSDEITVEIYRSRIIGVTDEVDDQVVLVAPGEIGCLIVALQEAQELIGKPGNWTKTVIATEQA